MKKNKVPSLPDLIASAQAGGVRLVGCTMTMDLHRKFHRPRPNALWVTDTRRVTRPAFGGQLSPGVDIGHAVCSPATHLARGAWSAGTRATCPTGRCSEKWEASMCSGHLA